eukprot:353511-Chlamydomonas_euryale.AAC.7
MRSGDETTPNAPWHSAPSVSASDEMSEKTRPEEKPEREAGASESICACTSAPSDDVSRKPARITRWKCLRGAGAGRERCVEGSK